MQRSPRRQAWFVLCAALFGCTQMVEFDRDKIGDDGGGGLGGLGGMDAAQLDSAAIRPDGAPPLPDTGVPAPDAAPQCTENRHCAANELCCAERCIATSVTTGCESCNTQCSIAADTCTGRSCTCGTSASCAGGTPFCAAPSEGATNRCLECRGDDDCTANGERQCVRGACAECDVADGNSGCANPTPICDDDACVGCDNSHPCGSGMTCVSGACYGCDDDSNAGCDPNGTTPICEPATGAPQAGLFQCVGCTTDAQCSGNPNGGQCVAGACEACDPRAGQNNAGCSGATPTCDAASSTCRACRAGDCAGASGTCSTSGPTAGRCVACTLDTQCSGTTPYCNPTDGTCAACSAATPAGAAVDDAWCADQDALRPICDSSGRCVRCGGSGTPRGCSAPNDQCVVNAGAPQNNICVDCVVSGTSHVGCAAGEQCLAVAAMPAMNRCVDCINDMGCSGMRGRCAPNNTCVECFAPADCPDDGNGCTTTLCMSNVCGNQALPVDDGIACTVDSCSGGTVTNTPDNSRCSNADMFTCTVPTCMPPTGCVEVPNHGACTDPLDCNVDMCVGAAGNATTGCSTASPCDGGMCLAGICMSI
jgi:hypothetical protein